MAYNFKQNVVNRHSLIVICCQQCLWGHLQCSRWSAEPLVSASHEAQIRCSCMITMYSLRLARGSGRCGRLCRCLRAHIFCLADGILLQHFTRNCFCFLHIAGVRHLQTVRVHEMLLTAILLVDSVKCWLFLCRSFAREGLGRGHFGCLQWAVLENHRASKPPINKMLRNTSRGLGDQGFWSSTIVDQASQKKLQDSGYWQIVENMNPSLALASTVCSITIPFLWNLNRQPP